MKPALSLLWMALFAALAACTPGCGSRQDDHAEEAGERGHGEEGSPSGASFKPGTGILLQEETKRIIGLEIADVAEQVLPRDVQLNVQIFVETHRLADLKIDHTGCHFHGSGFLPADKAALVQPTQSVTMTTSRGAKLDGFVVAAQDPLAHGEVEIIVGITTADSGLMDGEFVSASVSVPRPEPVLVIPRSALLRTVEGTYVYAVNGNAYYRTAVTVGSGTDDKIEVIDGLYAGDQVVAQPVETLWIIELRATKGGGHSH